MPAVAAVLSALHLLALALGLPSVWLRARALGRPLDSAGLRRVFTTDAVWGTAALLWVATGPARAFGPFEKGTAFYLSSRLFMLKMGLFALVLALEIWPMVTLIRWRMQAKRGEPIDTSSAPTMAALSRVEAFVVVVMVFVASFMARGFGLGG